MLGFFVCVLRLRRPLTVFFALVRSIAAVQWRIDSRVAAFRRPCDGASSFSDVIDPANSNRLKTNTFAPAPTLVRHATPAAFHGERV